MKKTWVSILLLVMAYPAQTQTARFGDSTGFVIRALNLELGAGALDLDLDCDGNNDINFEVLFVENPPQLRRTSISQLAPNSIFDLAVFQTGKVKNYQYQDTIQCLSPDLWTNFEFLVIGISGVGGYFGNCCFEQEYIGFRKRIGADTLLGWVKISSEFFPTPKIVFHEMAIQDTCTSSGAEPESEMRAASQAFPNPFCDHLQVNGAVQGEMIRLYNWSGQLLLQVPVLSSGVQQIDTSVLASGWYLLQMGKRFDRIVKVN